MATAEGCGDDIITEHTLLYLTSDESAAACYAEYNRIAPAHLKWDAEDRCPVLMAGHNITLAQRALVAAFEGFMGEKPVTWSTLMVNFSRLDEYIDLLCRLTLAE